MEEKIKEWACSFSGCIGGNIEADTWLCGIEPAGGSQGDYYTRDLSSEIKNGRVDAPSGEYDWQASFSYRYGVSFAKLYTAIKGDNVEDYKQPDKKGELFGLNLYPIAFDSVDPTLWNKYGLKDKTGFESKYLFNTWCFFNRFPFFENLLKEHSPELIICTGISYLRDFIAFFNGAKPVEKLYEARISPQSEKNKYERYYYWVKLQPGPLLVIVPFFGGRYGLNSNYLLQKMGEKISALIKSH